MKSYPKKPKKLKKNSAAYKRLRLECFERDDYTCRECDIKHPIEQHGLTPHHIELSGRYGPDTLENLVSLCTVPCHRLVTDGKIPNDYTNE